MRRKVQVLHLVRNILPRQQDPFPHIRSRHGIMYPQYSLRASIDGKRHTPIRLANIQKIYAVFRVPTVRGDADEHIAETVAVLVRVQFSYLYDCCQA